MFEFISGLSEAAAMPTEKKLKIAIVGEPKTGKSWFASTAPGPVYIADFDDRAESLRGKKDVFVKTYVDRNLDSPNAIQNLEVDLAAFKYAKSRGEPIPSSYVLDSATYMRKMCENQLMYSEKSLSRVIRVGSKTIKIASGWDVINANRSYMEYFIGEFSQLGHLIMVFHEQAEKDNIKSTKDTKAYTGRYTIQPQYLSSILSIFNEIWRIKILYDGSYSVEVKPSNEFLASTTLKLDANEKPSIIDMLKKHESRSMAAVPALTK